MIHDAAEARGSGIRVIGPGQDSTARGKTLPNDAKTPNDDRSGTDVTPQNAETKCRVVAPSSY
jgi:hypothetical protein